MAKTVRWYITTDQLVILEGLRRVLPVSALTQSAGTATLTSEAHGITTGDVIHIEGCDQEKYNGDRVGTSASADTITFTVASTAETPATGDIEASVYLDDATVTGSVANSGTITFDYKTGSNGVYVGTVPDATTFVNGTEYTGTFTVTAATGEVLTLYLTGKGAQYPSAI
jgi:hypothetical protein